MSKKKLNSSGINRVEKDLTGLANGFRQTFPKNQGLVIGGQSFTVSTFARTLVELTKPYEEARAAHAVMADKTRARDERHPAARTLVKNAKKFLMGYFGETNPKLRDFGIEPAKKPTEPSAKEKAEKVEKARLTRALKEGGGGPVPA